MMKEGKEDRRERNKKIKIRRKSKREDEEGER